MLDQPTAIIKTTSLDHNGSQYILKKTKRLITNFIWPNVILVSDPSILFA